MIATDRDILQSATQRIWNLLEKRSDEAYEVKELRKENKKLERQIERLKVKIERLKK